MKSIHYLSNSFALAFANSIFNAMIGSVKQNSKYYKKLLIVFNSIYVFISSNRFCDI